MIAMIKQWLEERRHYKLIMASNLGYMLRLGGWTVYESLYDIYEGVNDVEGRERYKAAEPRINSDRSFMYKVIGDKEYYAQVRKDRFVFFSVRYMPNRKSWQDKCKVEHTLSVGSQMAAFPAILKILKKHHPKYYLEAKGVGDRIKKLYALDS